METNPLLQLETISLRLRDMPRSKLSGLMKNMSYEQLQSLYSTSVKIGAVLDSVGLQLLEASQTAKPGTRLMTKEEYIAYGGGRVYVK